MDLRGHGKSLSDNDLDLSIEVQETKPIKAGFCVWCWANGFGSCSSPYMNCYPHFFFSFQTLCDDVLAVVKSLYGDSPPAIVLVGHRWVILKLPCLAAILLSVLLSFFKWGWGESWITRKDLYHVLVISLWGFFRLFPILCFLLHAI